MDDPRDPLEDTNSNNDTCDNFKPQLQLPARVVIVINIGPQFMHRYQIKIYFNLFFFNL
jgi:hypothetical protein